MNTENQKTEEPKDDDNNQSVEENSTENNPVDDQNTENGEDNEAESGDDVIVTFGDNEEVDPKEPEEESQTFRNLRKINREKDKELRKLQKELEQLKQPKEDKQLRNMPSLSEFDYDEDAYKADLEKWIKEKQSFEAKQQEKQIEKQREIEQAEAVKKNYVQRRAEVKYADFEDAEADVINALSQTQQDVILYSSDKPEMIVYALGKNPKILEDLKKETNPIKLASKIGKLEVQMKVKSRKPTTKPDTKIKSSGGVNVSSDKYLEQLTQEARRTKNYSKVHAYKRKLKQSN